VPAGVGRRLALAPVLGQYVPCQKRCPAFVYIHGDGVLFWSWGWVPGVQRALQLAGFPTFFELMPDSIEARAKYWLPFLREHVGIGENDVLLGWSCGVVAAMRCAQELRVRGLVLLAPYFTDLGFEQVRRAGWITEPWDWSRIRAHAARIDVFHSDADPYIPQSELAQLSELLQADTHVIRGAGHFDKLDSFPQLIAQISKTYAP
jgi:uncharacterized protein